MADDGFVDGDDTDLYDLRAVASKADDVQKEIQEQSQKVVDFLRMRQECYRRVFSGKGSPGDIAVVMTDLKSFCRGEATTYSSDGREHALLTGRQEVYMRIKDHISLDLTDMVDKYTTRDR